MGDLDSNSSWPICRDVRRGRPRCRSRRRRVPDRVGGRLGACADANVAQRLLPCSLGGLYGLRQQRTALRASSLDLFRPHAAVSLALSPIAAVVTSVSLIASAYTSETFRAGILGIDRGQFEAARALGFSEPTCCATSCSAQAIRAMLPPLGNIFIMVLKGATIMSMRLLSTGYRLRRPGSQPAIFPSLRDLHRRRRHPYPRRAGVHGARCARRARAQIAAMNPIGVYHYDWALPLQAMPVLVRGLWLTFEITAVASLASLFAGSILGLCAPTAARCSADWRSSTFTCSARSARISICSGSTSKSPSPWRRASRPSPPACSA